MIYGRVNAGGFGLLPGDRLLFSEFGGETPKGKPIVNYSPLVASLTDALLAEDAMYVRYKTSVNDETYKVSRTTGKVSPHSHLPEGEYNVQNNTFFVGQLEPRFAEKAFFVVKQMSFKGDVIWEKDLLEFDTRYISSHPKSWASLRVLDGRYFVAFGEERATNYPNGNIFIREYDAGFNVVLNEIDTGISIKETNRVGFKGSKDFLCISYTAGSGVPNYTSKRVTFSTSSLDKIGEKNTTHEEHSISPDIELRGFDDSLVYYNRTGGTDPTSGSLLSAIEVLPDGSSRPADILDISGRSAGRFMQLSNTKRLRYLNSNNKEVFRLGDDSKESVAVFTFPPRDQNYGNLINISFTNISSYQLVSTIPEFDLTPWQDR